ncbi:uncharacterized protein BT62DRAFT_963526 [Guyanagaster necrorhizus]|uniref:N-acetyltransferase domain-containing protein n=1 Tax=Guyanagaster necrorhizus TaxID=856835 RepID=A0A9P8AWA4_9AGAR|nr:uncharacterized protein BT62DRAFT_963526 [Guyanagaster necrorhizus MCA 3950]KAG7449976.1 hypothetical protein BT62DRAFT_963526 [Guyanagaster necrorhizus MCA 3950]
MPSVAQKVSTKSYLSATELLHDVQSAFESNEANFNVIYPHALKCRAAEQAGQAPKPGQVWIVCFSYDPEPCALFILSCTTTEMGKYPIFITTTCPTERLSPNSIHHPVSLLAKELYRAVPVPRVYSVFAPDAIAQHFARLWTGLTGVGHIPNPYYAAKLSFCTTGTFRYRRETVVQGVTYELCPAVASDIEKIAQLCYGFASESDPFFLDHAGALREATLLVGQNKVWVHRIRRQGEDRSAIASIVAFTRNSGKVATITKVYTNPDYRRAGCAERLVRRVCKYLFMTKEKVALYVAHNNPAASKVYHRVGFAGLGGDGVPVNGVDAWTEIGFDRDVIDLGHW